MKIVSNRSVYSEEFDGEYELVFEDNFVIIKHKDMPDMSFETNRLKIAWTNKKISIVKLDKKKYEPEGMLCNIVDRK